MVILLSGRKYHVLLFEFLHRNFIALLSDITKVLFFFPSAFSNGILSGSTVVTDPVQCCLGPRLSCL